MRVMVVLGKQGRLVIPADVRRRLDLTEGTELRLEVSDASMTLSRRQSRQEAATAIHGVLSSLAPGRSLADELLAERRAEAAVA